MSGIIPATITSAVSAADGNAPRRPVTRYDRALAALNLNPAALTTAIWPGRLVGETPAPMDRVDGAAYSLIGSGPTIIDQSEKIGFRGSDGEFIGLPTFSGPGLRSGTGVGKYSRSWSVIMVAAPDDASMGLFYSVGPASANGGTLRIGSASVYADTVRNNGQNVSVPRNRVNFGAPNIFAVCGDADSRQLVLYVNSLTPEVSATGLSPDPWPDLGAVGDWVVGLHAGSPFQGEYYSFAAFNRSLHHDPVCKPKLLSAIQAASESFGTTLV